MTAEWLQVRYPVMEHFYTLQGEGAFAGHAAYFIRTGGCDVGCHWCDVKESWDAILHPELSVEELIAAASQQPARLAVITGGEPLMYDMQALTSALKESGFHTHIETSGAYPLSGDWDWICLSPKKFKAPVEGIHQKASELKVIVYNTHDFTFAENHAKQVSPGCRLFLQPEWSRAAHVLPEIIEYVKLHPEWRISLQTHKYLKIP
jgi:organic radical activating enzyme